MQLTIGPNSVLTSQGLLVDGQHQPLRHREDFIAVARATGAAVAGLLDRLFPVAVAVPDPRGAAVPSTQSAWGHYNQALLGMQAHPPGADEVGALGAVLLRWCVAAMVVVQANRLAIADEPEFLAVRYLANAGPAALAYSRETWQAYLEWLAWSRSSAGAHAHLTGEHDRASAQRQPVHIRTSWPEDLGADMGGPGLRATHLSRLATDIIVSDSQAAFRFGSHTVNVDFGQDLVALFEEAAKDVSPEARTVERCLRWQFGEETVLLRTQRTRVGARVEYVFRVLATSTPNLSALWP